MSIKMGKYLLENITSGMYKDSRIIFREFIQNAADQIDLAHENNMFQEERLFIDIQIDKSTKKITVFDNATGITKEMIKQSLEAVADSRKEIGKAKGHRGIGRLGALANCEELIYKTTAYGEDQMTIMRWDGIKFKQLINDRDVHDDASGVMEQIIEYDYQPCDNEAHFFIVELNGVTSDALLNVEEVKKYISINAPVPYDNKFIYRSKVYDYLEAKKYMRNEYLIKVNGEDLTKPYTTVLYEGNQNMKKKYDEIYDISLHEFKNEKDETLAWLWLGISTFDKQIPISVNNMAGIRLRQANIQIGDEDTLVPFFREQRGNKYFIGELHAVHPNLVANGRRDYFVENETRNEFEANIKYYFENVCHNLYNHANKVKKALNKEIKYKELVKAFDIKTKEKKFIDEKDKKSYEHKIEEAQNDHIQAEKDLIRLREKAKENHDLNIIVKNIEKNHETNLKAKGLNNVSFKSKTLSQETKQPKSSCLVDELPLKEKEKRLISRIYALITDNLPPDTSNELINIIQKELKK